MRLRIATWNVNSVRLRLEHMQRFVQEAEPDVLCLQEIKCETTVFPADAFRELGYEHLNIRGQKGWHGVAIASRLPIETVPEPDVCREGHARVASGRIGGVEIHNFYIPAGGDVPDREENPKFDHKLNFIERLTAIMGARSASEPILLAGDFNVAPGENDVWSHRQMSKVVSHTPVELETLGRLRDSLGFIDAPRACTPEPQKLFSWWSYRAKDFRASNRGLRLDHLWLTPGLAQSAFSAEAGRSRVHDHVREWNNPSDHAPVTVDLEV